MSLPMLFVLVAGVALMMFGIFRFTIYKRNFTKSYNVAGFTVTPEFIAVAMFVIGFVMVLLFVITYLQPLFYQGRSVRPGITYVMDLVSQYV